MEREDEDAKKIRLQREKEEKDAINKALEDMDSSWEIRKDQQREKAERKRPRTDHDDGVKKKRRRRMEYALLDENWGEDEGSGDMEDQDGAVIVVPTPAPPKKVPIGRIITTITDYFPILRTPGSNTRMSSKVRMDSGEEYADLWLEPEDDKEWFCDQTSSMADLYNPEGKNNYVKEAGSGYKEGDQEDVFADHLSDQEWFEECTQQAADHHNRMKDGGDDETYDQEGEFDTDQSSDQDP